MFLVRVTTVVTYVVDSNGRVQAKAYARDPMFRRLGHRTISFLVSGEKNLRIRRALIYVFLRYMFREGFVWRMQGYVRLVR